MADTTKFSCDYGKRKSNCKKCKQPIEKGNPRIAKVVPNFFDDGETEMKQYHHIACMFEVFSRARATTKKVEDVSDLDGFADMNDDDKEDIKKRISELCCSQKLKKTVKKATPKKRKLPDVGVDTPPVKSKTTPISSPSTSAIVSSSAPVNQSINKNSKDNQFREFRRLCAMIADEASYNEKTNIVKNFLKSGSTGNGFTGDIYVILKLLMPGAVKRTYNLQSKQLVKLFSQIFQHDVDEMVTDLEQGDVSETIFKFFESSDQCPPTKKSSLTVHDVDQFLDKLSLLTREDNQRELLEKITKRCTANDLKTIIRFIKSDLKITAGPKHILDALAPNAHEAFKASRDLNDVINRVLDSRKAGGKSIEVRAALMTPVAPMLAEACKSVEQAMKKCPNGMYSEIKYDGERVQLHMKGGEFHFYSRSLKPVQQHKITHFDKFIPQAFPQGDNMILDSEVLLINTKTGNPLPFGTLGVHKKSKFQDANVCLFVFDILHFNGENVMKLSMRKRRKILEQHMTVIPNRVMLSEMKFVNKPDDLKQMIVRVIKEGLEGLVLKDVEGVYEPGKRHWLKVKKDYLMQGQMADSADLVVLGAYYGTGNKGGLMSVFLMGVYDDKQKRWCTVTKVGNGHDDKTLEKINKQLKVVKIGKDYNKVPKWLKVNKIHVPDLVVDDPKTSPVWEIVGTEFTKSESHTADGLSIRFPRVTKIRNDKTWENATSLSRLQVLYEKSKEESDVSVLLGIKQDSEAETSTLNVLSKPPGDLLEPIQNRKTIENTKASFLNNVFTGVRLFIPDEVKDNALMRRYVVAYNGDVTKDYELSNATHIVESGSLNNDSIPDSAKLVTPDHVWSCIRKKIML
ncbi:DNA ligase 3-like [Clavelina lepadiformis]|uniref:DNA ligase 3-like n=1 Tax=Clavelina lepadiformis TaxID=159417 RepID=UPI004042712C